MGCVCFKGQETIDPKRETVNMGGMVKLLLWRHAKAGGATPDQRDIDRPLAARGRDEAKAMAERIAATLHPDITLCSPAKRTRETLGALEQHLPLAAQIEESLYHCTAGDVLKLAARLDDKAQTALFIGHNPALETLMIMVGTNGQPHNIAAAMGGTKFKPGAWAVMTWETENWTHITADTARITLMVTP